MFVFVGCFRSGWLVFGLPAAGSFLSLKYSYFYQNLKKPGTLWFSSTFFVISNKKNRVGSARIDMQGKD